MISFEPHISCLLSHKAVPENSWAVPLLTTKRQGGWLRYYIGMFADRDMVMRYLTGGIGHKATHDFAPPTAPQDLVVEDDTEEQVEQMDDGAEEDMDGVEATEDIGSGEDDSGEDEGSLCDGEKGDYGYEDENESEVDEMDISDSTDEVDEFSDDGSDGFVDL
ncbi:uncharacterized protein LACBIDRAFT_319112 [Laccaria bicolor S238N-H82]|uniref:Predicted protein n=1 Tax=Laccaria bicolor (strain S238N-H82 / ATCC MYA-4686) TaxID=486041 RepID=B0D7W9_LACBS|nr:uncharacterized protein LACBIDRAFT_319112 [Laccaria bicolor S238N-H82]EDR09479.1 predicted protein [Laccaria bicolor S238N-H82]|eukprot:XP_001879828.1 predicted protein [Laccaria bicolor S238N-H82]